MSTPVTTSLFTFIDTNVWLYALLDNQDPRKAQIAHDIIRATPDIVLSVQVVNEICVNLVKNKLLDEPGIRALIESYYVKYSIVDLDPTVLLKASQLREVLHLSYWDSLIIAAALVSGCSRVLSEDMQDGLRVENQLSILNPFT